MTGRFTTVTGTHPFWRQDVVALADHEHGSWAQIVPAEGCNLISFGADLGGKAIETFLQPEDESPSRPLGHYGAPVLFPFPNRLRNGRARFGGREIVIDLPPGQPHAIHGLVRDRRWEVEGMGDDAECAQLRCSIESDAALRRQFPFAFRLTLTFRLAGTRLRVDVRAENQGDAPMPIGFGWHPYFRLPLVPGGDRAAQRVRVPAKKLWQLDETLVPTGEVVPVAPGKDFRAARPIGTIDLDDVYTDVDRTDGGSLCELSDPGSGATLSVVAGPSFREWVVYAPPARPTICFEPYTCPTDAFNLAERGIEAGVIVLKPGESWADWLELRLNGPAA